MYVYTEATVVSTTTTTTTTTYSIVGDNLDKTIRPRYMRIDSGNKLLHYFHHIAIADRIDVSNLSITPPAPPTMPHKKCATSLLPSTDDDKALEQNMTTLVSRIIVNHMWNLSSSPFLMLLTGTWINLIRLKCHRSGKDNYILHGV